MSDRSRFPAIDELKGLAIFLVLIFHCTCALRLPNLSLGHSGVDIFLVLSGFGLSWGLREESGGRFLTRRLAAILPRYWLALALVVLGNGWVLGHWESAKDIILHALALHALDRDAFYAINISWWFMAAIVPLYGLAALLRPWLAAGRVDRVIAAGLAVTVIVHRLLALLVSPFVAGHFGAGIPEFVLGLAAGCVLRRGWTETTTLTPTTGAALLAYVLYCGIAAPELLTNPDPAYGFAWAAGWLLITGGEGAWRQRLRGLAAAFGAISFEFYLFHLPIVSDYNHQLWLSLFPGREPGALPLLAGMAAGFVLLIVFCRAFQRLLQPRSAFWSQRG